MTDSPLGLQMPRWRLTAAALAPPSYKFFLLRQKSEAVLLYVVQLHLSVGKRKMLSSVSGAALGHGGPGRH